MSLLEILLQLLGLALFLVLVLALLSPFEAMGWWAGWMPWDLEPDPPSASPSQEDPAEHYLVYLTGIAGFSGAFLARREEAFLRDLEAAVPGLRIVADVFPFSVNNNPLDGERFLRGLWQALQDLRIRRHAVIYDVLIALRNLFQVAVSADPRYGPIYNLGVARELIQSLGRHGYVEGSGTPVTLLAYSGGAQVAVGAARFMAPALGLRPRVVALGGVFSDDPGLDHVERLDQVRGSRDWLPGLLALLFPGRWPLLPYSGWNRARREGRVRTVDAGPILHVGRRDYFSRKACLPDGRTHGEATAALVAELLREAGHPPREERDDPLP